MANVVHIIHTYTEWIFIFLWEKNHIYIKHTHTQKLYTAY